MVSMKSSWLSIVRGREEPFPGPSGGPTHLQTKDSGTSILIVLNHEKKREA
jgi:hypothetical protein